MWRIQFRLQQNRQSARTHQTAPAHVGTNKTPVAAIVQRAMRNPAALSAFDVIRLQRVGGNRAVARMLSVATTRPGPTVVPEHDPSEREAERAASMVNLSPQPALQRSAASTARSFGAAASAFDGHLESAIQSARRHGQPLNRSVKQEMGAALNADFNRVKLHTDTKADTLSRALNAKAFTSGKDIFFRKGEYNPNSQRGKQVLAHELTHVRQQSGAAGSGVNRMIQRLAYNDNPYPNISPVALNGPNDYVKKSDSGQTGVYFAKQANDKIVIKFLSKGDALSSQYADQIIRHGTGLETPNSRGFLAGSQGFNALTASVMQWAAAAPHDNRVPPGNRIVADAANDTAGGEVAVVMSHLQGVPMDEMAKDPDQHARLLEALRSRGVQTGIAKLLVVDALLGNSDRIDRGVRMSGGRSLANIGNLFVARGEDRIQTLDSAAERIGSVNAVNARQSLESKMGMLKDITNEQNIDPIIDALLDACVETARPIDGGALAMLLGEASRRQIKTGVRTAVQRERSELLVSLKGNKATLKQVHAELTGAYANRQSMPDWDTLRVKTKFLQMRNKGKSEADALTKAVKHYQHKQNKAAGNLAYQKVPLVNRIFG